MPHTFTLFPKFLKTLSAAQLARTVRDCGLGAVNAIVREGYWVEPGRLAADLPDFVRTVRGEGVEVFMASTGYMPDELLRDESPLAAMAKNGIRAFRMGYFKSGHDVRASMDGARRDMASMAGLCEKHGVKAIYQVHHGTLLTNASAAWHVMGEIDPRWVGIMIDPGNQVFEGHERPAYSVSLLGKHLAAVGVKDALLQPTPDGGVQGHWTPLGEGLGDWVSVARAMRQADANPIYVFMPFCEVNDPERNAAGLKRDVDWLKKALAAN